MSQTGNGGWRRPPTTRSHRCNNLRTGISPKRECSRQSTPGRSTHGAQGGAAAAACAGSSHHMEAVACVARPRESAVHASHSRHRIQLYDRDELRTRVTQPVWNANARARTHGLAPGQSSEARPYLVEHILVEDLVAAVVGLACAQCQYLGFGGFFLGRIWDDNTTLRLLLLVLDRLNNNSIAERF